MGYARIKQQDHNNTYYTEFVCDTIADVALLPTSPKEVAHGSAAICLENGEVYMLNGQGRWVMIE